MNRLLIIGPPGVGKGTQAARLSNALAVPAISTGDMFREQMRIQSALGLTVAVILAAGDYVPDDTTNAVVEARVQELDAANGFILDGYPRTVAQVDELDGILARASAKVDAVLHLDANQDELVSRLLMRGAEGGRSDDTTNAIRHRIDVYTAQTEPLLEAYNTRGLLVTVNGLGSVEAVWERVMGALALRTGVARVP